MTRTWLQNIPDFIPQGDQKPFILFTYGVKMFLLARNADNQEPAYTWGSLQSPKGLLQFPGHEGLLRASGNPTRDAEIQKKQNQEWMPNKEQSDSGQPIFGKLLTFHNPAWRIPPVDRFLRYGFVEDDIDLVLLPVIRAGGGATWAWCHVSGKRRAN